MGIYLYKLPDIGEGVVEAEITAWHVAVGDTVSEEDPIADAMTDKATIELTAPVDGVIKSIACEEGDMLAVGGVLVELEVEGEGHAPAAEPEADPVVAETTEPKPERTPLSTAGVGQSAAATPLAPQAKIERKVSQGKVLASPAIRKRAEALNIDLASVPTAHERLTHADLDAYLLSSIANPSASPNPGAASILPDREASGSAAPATPKAQGSSVAPEPLPGETRQKVIGLRRVIATRMQEAKRHIPHFTYVEEIDMTALEAMRKRMNVNSGEDKPKLTVLPLLIRALSVTLDDWPQFNARYMDQEGYVSRFADLNLGIATQTDGGLIVPVVQKANSLSIWQLAEEIARLAEAARTNTLATTDLEGATTTLTSLGPLGGIVTTPVINRPEVAIFGPNKIREKLVLEAGEVFARKVMNFSISCDHRVIDGYDAAKMMQDLKARLEDPRSIFIL